jgi:hypothetical protein
VRDSPERQAVVLVLASGVVVPLTALSAFSAVQFRDVAILLLVSLAAFAAANLLALVALAPSGWLEGIGPRAPLVFWAYACFVAGVLMGGAGVAYAATKLLEENRFL